MLIINAKTGNKFVRIIENPAEKSFIAILVQNINTGIGTEEQGLDLKSYSTLKGAKAYAARKLK